MLGARSQFRHALKEDREGRCYGDYAEAVNWYRKAAEQGLAEAQNSLGAAYAEGHGVAQDYGEAVKWYRKAAEQGNVMAQENLGNMYAAGRGVAEDRAEARKWREKAAEQKFTQARKAAENGDAEAQYDLGNMYALGRGVVQDVVWAHMWFNIAGSHGNNRKAMDSRDEISKSMSSAQIAAAQKLAREWTEKY